MLSDIGSSPDGQSSRSSAPRLLERAALDVDVDERGERGRADDRIAGGEQRQRGDGVGLGAGEIADPFARGGAQPERARVEEHRAARAALLDARGPHLDRPARAGPRARSRRGAAVSAIVVAGAASAGCSRADLDQQLPVAPRRLARAPRPRRRCGRWWRRRPARSCASRLRSAAVSPRLHLGLEREQPRERLGAGEPADQAGGGRLELERPGAARDRGRRPSRGRPRRRRSPPAARRRGSAPSRGRGRPARARPGCSTGVCASSMRPAASGMRAADSAAPSSSRIARRSAAGASSSSARRRKRTAWSGAPRSPARRAAAVSASNAQGSPTGPAGRGQQVGGRALAARRVARQRAGGGEMQLRPLGRRDRVLERLLDDRMDEPRRQAGMQELGLDQRVDGARGRLAVDARDLRGVRERGVVAEDRQRLRDRADRRGRRRSRAATKRATDGGPIAAIAPASRLAGRSAALLEGGDELAREQRVPARRPGAFGADLVARLRAEAAADQLGDRRRAERLRAHRRQRLALDQPGQRLRRRPTRPCGPRGSRRPGAPRSAPPGRRGSAANARRPSARRRRAGRAAAPRPAARTASAGRGSARTGGRRRPRGREPPRTAGAPAPRRRRTAARARASESGSMLGASSWITTPRANSRSIAPPRARRTAIPSAWASAAAAPSSELLPIPGAPSITTTRPSRPPRRRAHRRSPPARPRAPAGGVAAPGRQA